MRGHRRKAVFFFVLTDERVAATSWGKMQHLNKIPRSALVATILALSTACIPDLITGENSTSSESSGSNDSSTGDGDPATGDSGTTGDGDGDPVDDGDATTCNGDGDGDWDPATTGDGDYPMLPCCLCDDTNTLVCVGMDGNQCPEDTSATLISCE